MKIIGSIMTAVGLLAAGWFGYDWYSQAVGIWTAYDEAGKVKGYGYAIALTFVAAVIAAAGIACLVRSAKKKKSK